MNLNVIEMVSIDHKSTAKLLQILDKHDPGRSKFAEIAYGNDRRSTGHGKYIVNKMMENICWFLGHEPDMVLNGKVTTPDAVAQSILDLPLICGAFAYYIIELVDSSVDEDNSSESSESSSNSSENNSSNENSSESSKNSNNNDKTQNAKVKKPQSSQYIGACITLGEEFVAQEISCYLFIDWLNIQDTNLTNRQVKKVEVVTAFDTIIHIRCVV